jgi:hypothetical protein
MLLARHSPGARTGSRAGSAASSTPSSRPGATATGCGSCPRNSCTTSARSTRATAGIASSCSGPVGLELGLLREELGPVVARLERITVEVVAHVDAAARVAVLVPGAADARVLLEDRVRDAGFLEPDPREQPRLAAADHDHGKLCARRGGHVVPVERALVAAGELHLLEHHRHVLVGHLGADEPAHHLADQLGSGRRRQHAAAVAVLADHVERLRARTRLHLLGHEALHLVQEQALRLQVAADPRRIARDVHERQEQRRDADVFERGGDRRVVVGDRRARVQGALVHLEREMRAVSVPLRRRAARTESPSATNETLAGSGITAIHPSLIPLGFVPIPAMVRPS